MENPFVSEVTASPEEVKEEVKEEVSELDLLFAKREELRAGRDWSDIPLFKDGLREPFWDADDAWKVALHKAKG